MHGKVWTIAAFLVGAVVVALPACRFDPSGLANPGAGTCGDGVVDANETCDDGNAVDGDGCYASCQVESGWSCSGAPSVCQPTCGDGLVRAGEGCDDGNAASGDGCDARCALEPGWICAGEPSSCQQTCGDGLVDFGEGCDDGNLNAGDGCNASCQGEPGYNCVGAPSVCTPDCGDGLVVGSEACDDGNNAAGDGCSAGCQVEGGWSCSGAPSVCAPVCGDGQIRGGETCDDGDASSGDGCDASCRQEAGWSCFGQPSVCAPVCGDGLVMSGEMCDDGNATAGDGCSAGCQWEPGWSCAGEPSVCAPVCGDGLIRGGEQCDDGDTDPGDGCDGSCQPEAGWNCTSEPSLCSRNGGNDCATAAVIGGSTTLTDTTAANTDLYDGAGCPGITNPTDGPDTVYAIPLTAGQYLVAWLTPDDGGATPWDGTLYLSTGCPDVDGTCTAGWQRAAQAGARERIDYVATASTTLYLVVDGQTAADAGSYTLEIDIGGPVSAADTSGQVVFSELMPNPFVSNDGCEWLEIHNTTAGALDLFQTEFSSQDGTFSITSDLVLRAGEYAVVARNYAPQDNCGLDRVSWHYSGSGFDLRRLTPGTRIGMADTNATVLDEVTYSPTWPYADGETMYLCTNHLTAGDNDTAANWANGGGNTYGSGGSGTPAAANPGTCN